MIHEIAVVSGKGGTGKTTIAASFAAIGAPLVLADCDVDASDLHILLHPTINKKEDFIASKVAVIDPDLCTDCGLCVTHCRYGAAYPPHIDTIACEGCGVCEYVCPTGAIRLEDKVSGMTYESQTRFGPMSHARLHPGEGNSGKLVTEVRKRALRLAQTSGLEKVLIDGSPGVGCPVIATLTGARLGIVVTEPTVSGIHDMERVLDLMARFRVTPLVILNKYDLNPSKSEEIEEYCREQGIEILGRIPFNPIMTESMVQARTLPEYAPGSGITQTLRSMWNRVVELLTEIERARGRH